MFKKTILFVAAAGILGAGAGCSSSGSNSANNPDGSTGTGTPGSDAATGDSGTSDDAAATTTDGSSGPCPGPVTSTDIPTYNAATATPGACTAAQISTFITACASQTASQAACTAWFSPANQSCGACIQPRDGKGQPVTGGPVLVTSTGQLLTNTPGCVAMEDPTNGPACAAPLANYAECVDVACGQCGQGAATACEQTTSTGSGACASYYTAFASACATDVGDGGVASAKGECQNPSFIINLYCGGGDAGAGGGDAGDAGDGG